MESELVLVDGKRRLYLASPLFNVNEREFNLKLKRLLSRRFEVYLPQEDGGLMVEMVEEGLPLEEAARSVFKFDVNALLACDLLLIVMDGRAIDEGAAFELGFAFAHGKPCYGFQTDVRRLVLGRNNPMIECAVKRIFRSVDELMEWAHLECIAPLTGVT